MYGGKNGVYPEGQYEVGVDIAVGTYILRGYDGYDGNISIYNSYKDFTKNEMLTFKSFEKEYHLPLRQVGMYIEVENATLTRV